MTGRSAFIGGMPTAGKTTLARALCAATGARHVALDDLRAAMWDDPALRPWARFFLDRDEARYWAETSPEVHWANVAAQAAAFWPRYLEKIRAVEREGASAVYESIALLPSLVRRDLDLPGVVLLTPSFEEVLRRNTAAPRWGATPELIEREARALWDVERPAYEREARAHGIPVFSDPSAAEFHLLKHLGQLPS